MDDLEDLVYLERDVKATAVVLLFLTKSYFRSTNCLREIRACALERKPIILVRLACLPLKNLTRLCAQPRPKHAKQPLIPVIILTRQPTRLLPPPPQPKPHATRYARLRPIRGGRRCPS